MHSFSVSSLRYGRLGPRTILDTPIAVTDDSDSYFAPSNQPSAAPSSDAGVSAEIEAPVGIILTEAPVIEPVRINLKVNDYQFYRPDDRMRVVRPAPKSYSGFP